MAKIGIVVNPASKRNRKPGAEKRLRELVNGHDVIIKVAKEVDPEVSIDTYKKPLEELLEQNIDILAVASGDGGHHLLDTAYFSIASTEEMVPQINLRGGTMNIRAECVGLPRRNILDWFRYTTTEHVLKNLLERYSDADPKDIETVNRNLLRVTAQDKTRIGFSYGSGFAAQFVDKYYDYGGSHMAALVLMGRSILNLPFSTGVVAEYLRPTNEKVYLDFEEQEGEEFKCLFATSVDITMDFGPMMMASEITREANETENLRFFSSRKLTRWDLLRQIPRFFRSKWQGRVPLSIEDLVTKDVSRIDVYRNETIKYFVDADLYETDGHIIIEPTKPVKYITL